MACRDFVNCTVVYKKFAIFYENCTFLQSRKNLKEMEDLFYDLSNFAAEENEWEGLGLKDVVEKVKPDILIGLSGQGGIFTGFTQY